MSKLKKLKNEHLKQVNIPQPMSTQCGSGIEVRNFHCIVQENGELYCWEGYMLPEAREIAEKINLTKDQATLLNSILIEKLKEPGYKAMYNYLISEKAKVDIQLVSAMVNVIRKMNKGSQGERLHTESIDCSNPAPDIYHLNVSANSQIIIKK